MVTGGRNNLPKHVPCRAHLLQWISHPAPRLQVPCFGWLILVQIDHPNAYCSIKITAKIKVPFNDECSGLQPWDSQEPKQGRACSGSTGNSLVCLVEIKDWDILQAQGSALRLLLILCIWKPTKMPILGRNSLKSIFLRFIFNLTDVKSLKEILYEWGEVWGFKSLIRKVQKEFRYSQKCALLQSMIWLRHLLCVLWWELLWFFGLKSRICAPFYSINPNRRHLTNSAEHRSFKMFSFLSH